MGNESNFIGKQVGNYRIISKVAIGAFGSVYAGKHAIFTKRPIVAIKLLHALLDSEEERNRFLQEAELLETLKHPHILPIIDAGVHEGVPYLVAEYATNGSLRDRLKRSSSHPLSTVESLSILSQIGQALQHAHDQNIIHRDLKPENILFNTEGEVLLADFGIAVMLPTANIKQTAHMTGTPHYMAPEQFRGVLTKECDQYALGCIAYELLTGRKPFTDDDIFVLMDKHKNEYPTAPRQLNPNLPLHMEQAIGKAMAKQRTDRHADVSAFITALQIAPISQTLTPPVLSKTEDDQHIPSHAAPDSTVVDSSPARDVPVQENADVSPTKPLSTDNDAIPQPDITEFPQPHARTTGQLPIPAMLPIPEDQPQPSPITPILNRRTTGSLTPVSANGMGAGINVPDRPIAPVDFFPTTGNAGGGGSGGPRRRRVPSVLLLLGLIALLLLTPLFCVILAFTAPGALGPLGNIVPHDFGSPSATVTLTPKRTELNTPFVIFGVPDTPTHADIRPQSLSLATSTPTSTPPPRQVQTRVLSYTTPAQSKMVNATGVQDIPATQAIGTLTFSNGSFSEFTVSAGTTLTGSDGVSVITDAPAVIPAGTTSGSGKASASAHAANAGASGNIAAGDINATCCASGSFILAYNSAFSGGQDPQHYSYVQQSDIDGAATPLEAPLEQKALTAVQGQKKAHEQFVAKPLCSPNVTSNAAAGDKASSVTVTVTATCSGVVYDPMGAQTLAVNLLKNQATKSLGADYVLVGNITSSVTKATVIDAKKGTVSLVVSAQGMWVYQFSNMQKQRLAKLIAGKSKKDATTLLMQQPGVAQVKIDLANGDTLPIDESQITFVV